MNSINKNAIIGLVFIAIGAIFLLDNLEIISWRVRHYLFQWENIFLIVGLVLITNRENFRKGLIFLAIGIFLNLDNWFHVDVNLFDLWPVALVLIGIALIARNKTSEEKTRDSQNEGLFDADKIDDTAIFGGGDKVVNSQSFKGGMLTAIFGGSNIDLTQAKLADGRQVIDVFFLFGGSKIRVPQDWQVEMNVTGIFGGMSDKRKFVDPELNASKRLYIKGTAIFGGADVSN
uniref:LiaI-LiaF-like domain-containing protein n=4 Tax=Roseivirga sp. TaxID=1964215 RepID=UPI004047F7CC